MPLFRHYLEARTTTAMHTHTRAAPYRMMGCSGRFLNSDSFSETNAAEPRRTKACTPALATCGHSKLTISDHAS